MNKAFVLLSGGIDSTTCLYEACGSIGDVEAISIFYGQRHRKEIEYAKRSCGVLSVPHSVLDLSSIVPKTMLTDAAVVVPSVSYSELPTGISPTYVPFRNGLMLSAVASHITGKLAPDEKAEWALYFGAHAEDAANWAYPDCTPEFIGAMANAIYIGTYQKLRLYTPLEWLTKADIIKLGDSLGVDWRRDTWSCYKGEEKHCGICPTCRARRDGFKAANVEDPTEYAG